MVESLPIHEDIKRGSGDLDPLFSNYRQWLENLAAEGVKAVCYNFMPILDWTRTDLNAPAMRGGTCLRFSAAKMAAFEIHMLGRLEANELYTPEAIEAGTYWYRASSDEDRDTRLQAIMAGLPMRSDHGHALLYDIGKDYQPGYTLIGRLRGLSELRGVMRALRG